MKSNLREGLLLLFWLLFFILLIFKEFKSSWIPTSVKSEILKTQLENRLDEVILILEEMSNVNDISVLEDFHKVNFNYPVFVFAQNDLVYWNSNDVRPPSNIDKIEEGIHFRNNGFSQSLICVKKNERGRVYIAFVPLWKHVGIENEWLSEGSNSEFSFKWKVSELNQCENKISLRQNINLNICFDEDEKSPEQKASAIDFALIFTFLLLLALAYYKIKNSLVLLNDDKRKILGISTLALFILLLIFEYSRRFILDPSPNSVFFVVYPYLLAFLISTAFIYFPAFKEAGRLKKIIVPILLFTVYAFSKSYWIEIFDKESFDLDLINFVRFEWKTLDAYLGLFGMSLVYFIATSQLLIYAAREARTERSSVLVAILLALVFFLFEGIANSEWYFAYLILAFLYSIWTLNFKAIRSKALQSNIAFLITAIFLISFFITETTGYGNQKKERKQMKSFVSKSMETQFEIEKNLLSKAAKEISEDKLISIAFSNPLTSRDIINQKIKKVYLDSYFDPFEVNIDFLNANGDNLNPQAGYRNLFFFKSNYLREERAVTDMVYYLEPKDDEKSNDYFIHVELKNEKGLFGHILVEVFRDKSSPNSIFPKLLVDKKYRNAIDNKYQLSEYSFDKLNELAKDFELSPIELDNIKKLKEGEEDYLRIQNRNILMINDGKELISVAATKTKAPSISSFSIVFMILSFLTILLYWIIVDFKFRLRDLPFRQKIQFFMNLTFLLPLIIVSLSVLKFMNDNDRENVESNYLEKVRVISEGIEIPFLDYKNGLIPKRVFLDRASRAAGMFSLDFFIYNLDGSLNSSSKEILWERGITNRLIEPGAYFHFKENSKDVLIRENQINDFKYKIAYASLEDLNNQEIGILGVPFYESREELESRFIQLLSTVINIFVLTFIVFLVFSNRLTDWLMVPVLRLSDRIKITSFENKNEPLEWNTKDEIGRLVKSYNDMIDKLNESRNALARTEKEAAWREMAQQVAHEIKNPLTPMRLRLQQLIRQQDPENPETEKLKQTFNSLLHQVDTLSEIATSFSEFARMPNPKNEKVNLNEVIQLASNIYLGKKDIELNIELPKKQLYTNADENMFSRSIGNIILNGIQSVHDDKNPRIDISLRAQGKMAELRIRDNGEGIGEDLRERIFIPHFSTKSSGTGIGLALAKKTIESANGQISFESSSEGTEFLIKLPLIED